MKRLVLLVSGLAALLLSSCATCWSGGIPLRPTEAGAQRGAAADLGDPAQVRVYRGLAHPNTQQALYQRQVAAGGWIEIHDFKFFEDPLDIDSATVAQVLDLYRDPASHQAWGPKSTCAGFHPDYVLVWDAGSQRKALQLCYGCHEWKFFGPGGELLTDISEQAYFGPLTRQWLPKDP